MGNLAVLETTKNDIKNAILNKGSEITGGLTTYGDSIRNIKNETTNVLPRGVKLAYSSSNDVFHEYDYSKIEDCSYLFYKSSFTIADGLNVKPNSYTWNKSFEGNTNLVEVKNFSTHNMKNCTNMFYGCSSLTDVCQLNGGSMREMGNMFRGCSSLQNFGGIRNLGATASKVFKPVITYMFVGCVSLTRDSVLNIFNNLYDLNLNGGILTLNLPLKVLERISDEDIAIATNKGWYISTETITS